MCIYEPRGKRGGLRTQQDMVGVGVLTGFFCVCVAINLSANMGMCIVRTSLVVLQPVPLIPVYSPCVPQVPQPLSVLIHICSELDLMLPVTLLSVPNLKMGTCASGRTRKESLFFKINS